jgi:hypothetical protein
MKRTKHPRLVAPTVVFVAGTGMAGAVAAGHTWGDALITEVITIVLAGAYYALTASHSDIGDIYAQREDERQVQMLLRARSTAWLVMIAASFVCALIAVASNRNYWQADVIGSLGGFSFLFGLLAYSSQDVAPSDSSAGIMAGHHDGGQTPEESAER